MSKRATIYSHNLDAIVLSQIPQPIREAMDKLGWNAFGIYEIVRDEMERERRQLKRARVMDGKQPKP